MLKTSFATGVILASGVALMAQVQTEVPPVVPGAKPVSVERIKVHGASLEGNLEGDSADREVFVLLPPTYATAKTRPLVVYALHGYSIGAEHGPRRFGRTFDGATARAASA